VLVGIVASREKRRLAAAAAKIAKACYSLVVVRGVMVSVVTESPVIYRPRPPIKTSERRPFFAVHHHAER